MAPVALLFGLVSLLALPFQVATHALDLGPRLDHGQGSVPIDKRTAQEVITKLNLTSNPEKGYFVQTFEDTLKVNNNRSASTAIYYLLEGSVGASLWHRIDSVEVWHYYAGAPLTLSLSLNDGSGVRKSTLGPDVFNNQQPQVVIDSWEWQSARSLGSWTLVGTTVAPGFDATQYEIQPEGWEPS